MHNPLHTQKITFEGRKAIRVNTSGAELIATYEFGPLISHFGVAQGRNLLFWDGSDQRRRGNWILRGGHRVWTTRPLADETEEAYAEDHAQCNVETSETKVILTAPPHPLFHIQKSIEIEPVSPTRFLIHNKIANASDMLWSGGVWALTACAPGPTTTYGIPLGELGTASWDVFSIVFPRKWAGHSSQVNDPQISYTEDCLILTPQGVETKRMIQAPKGIIGMSDAEENVSFLKKIVYDANAQYPLNTNIAFYVGPGNFMVEMETMSPVRSLRPGESLVHTEEWSLVPLIDWRKLSAGW